MSQLYEEYTQQLRDALDRQSALGRLSYWLEKHTKHAGAPYSFKGHEFQRAIIDSRHNNAVIIKPSQVGLTEGGARFILGFISVELNVVAMYLLPTVGEVQRAVKSRFDPIIAASPYIKSIINPGSDSSSFKQIGDSQLVTGGTFGKAIISIPTDLLSIDELDFCNQENVATAESRLTHSRFIDEATGARGIKRKWSTPTAVGVGVDALYAQSNQYKRLVKCKHCGHHFWPQFLKHVVVPGWDREMEFMTYIDAQGLDDRGLLSHAKLLCEACHNPITKENLRADYREWVAEYPSKTRQEGWHVNPFDLPDYHTPESILRKMIDYRNNVNHFHNFVLGLAHSDASNSIIDEWVESAMTVRPIRPEEAEAGAVSGCVAGLDVGRTSWLVIGKPNYFTKTLDVVWVEQLRLQGSEEDDLRDRVLERLRQYGVVKFVCDAMPYTPTILAIQAKMPEDWVLPNFYNLQDKKLPMYVVNQKDKSLSSHRTKTLNLAAKKVNSQQIRWPQMEEMRTVRKHLQGMKRVDRVLDTGEEESEWIKSGDDHYFHATNYLSLAHELIGEDTGGWAPVPTIREVIVGSKHVD
jgi:hypothetical protein